jgi:hypothetical protein
VAKIKDKDLKPNSKPNSEYTGKGQIINIDSTTIVVIAAIEPEEPTDPEEGEPLFHSHIWVKGTLLYFITDNGSQNNLIST